MHKHTHTHVSAHMYTHDTHAHMCSHTGTIYNTQALCSLILQRCWGVRASSSEPRAQEGSSLKSPHVVFAYDSQPSAPTFSTSESWCT